MRLLNSAFQTQFGSLTILRSGAGKRMKYVLSVAEQATMLIIVQINHDAEIAVELILPITTGVMLTYLDVKLTQPWQESI